MSATDLSSSGSGESRPARLARRLAGLVWWLAVVLLVLMALYVGIGRQLTQNIGDYRQSVERLLSDSLGYEVSIGSLQAHWRWLDPVLETGALRVRLADAPEQPLVDVGHVRIRLDSLQSLLRFRVVFREFEVDRFDLALTQSEDGRFALPGRRSGPVESDGNAESDWLGMLGRWLSDPSIRITRINLTLKSADDTVRHIEIPQLDLHYDGGLFSASGRAMRSGTTHQLASFSLLGLHFFRGDFTGQLYVDMDSGRLFDELVRKYEWRGVGIEGFDAGGQAWFTFRDGFLEQLSGHLRVPYLQLRAGAESMAPVENLSLNFGWRGSIRLGRGNFLSGELHLQEIQWDWLGESVSEFSLRLKKRARDLRVNGDGVPLGSLSRFTAGIGLLPDSVTRALEGYRPEGLLNDLEVRVPTDEAGPEFRFFANLEDVQVAAHNGAPEVAGANGRVIAGRDWGVVDVSAEDLTLGFPKLFRDSWLFRHGAARVAWHLDGQITRVFSDSIHMQYGERTELTGAFDLRMDKEGEDNLGLKVGVQHGAADMLAAFVPAKVVSAPLYEWLTTAVTSAEIEEGVYYGHGQINRNAPRYSFTSSMSYRFRDGVIRYDPAWPEVTNASGRVLVHDGYTDVQLTEATTGGLVLEESQVTVSSDGDGVVLKVDTGTTVPGEAIAPWLANSPLGAMSGNAAEVVEVDGDYELDLGLELPLSSQRDILVSARVRTRNGEVRYPAAGLQWSGLQGELDFRSDRGFSSQRLNAIFMDKPVTLGLEYQPGSHKLVVSQSGRLTVPELKDLMSIPPDTQTGLAGSLAYTARLDVSPGTASGLSIYSSLAGLSVDWPQPLGKQAEVMAPIRAVVDWDADSELLLSGVWDERLAFRMRWLQQGFDRGQIVLGSQSAELPESEGIALAGTVARINVDEWTDSLSRIAPTMNSVESGVRSDGDYDAAIEQWLSGIQLSIGELEALGQSFPQVDVAARLEDGHWRIESTSERASGRLLVPMDKSATVDVDFQTLNLQPSEATGNDSPAQLTASQQVDAFRALAMEGWPDIRVNIGRLVMEERSLGSWSFLMKPDSEALHVDDLRGTLGTLTFTGDLWWDIRDGEPMSRLQGELTGQDLGDLARLVGAATPLRNEKTQLQMSLDWSGRPDDFELTRLEGEVSIRLDEGVILESNNTAQLFRLFNVLNADTLWRRLQLDFSDLYERGVAFDAISGTAQLNDGTLSWSPELQIVGPSGAFKLSGSTDMVAESLDMRLVVVLPLTQNLPLAALLMGASAPIGGALFVLDKILGDPLSKLTSATYSVTGSWDQPNVKLRNVFDTGS